MSVAVTVGKRVLQADDVVSMLSGHNMWPQLMEAMVVDRLCVRLRAVPKKLRAIIVPRLLLMLLFLRKKGLNCFLKEPEKKILIFLSVVRCLLERFKEQTVCTSGWLCFPEIEGRSGQSALFYAA